MPNELLPTNIGFGTVVGRFGSAPLIAGDADGFPDFSPAAGLTVTFTPSTAAVIDATASPAPVTIEMVPIVCGLDTQGYLVGGDGQRGVKLIATDDTDINPSGWTYSVTFLRAGAKVAAFRDFSMSLPQGVTKDIALTIPVPSSSGVSLSQAQAAEAAAVSAASQASAAAAAAAASAATFVPATVDTLGQATTVGKAVAKATTIKAAQDAISAAPQVAVYLPPPTSSADQTATIQTVLNTVPSGGTLIVGDRHRVDGQLNITTPMTVQGSGRGEFYSTVGTAAQTMLNITSSDVAVDLLTITGPQFAAKATQTGVNIQGASGTAPVNNVSVTRCLVTNFGKNGILGIYMTDFVLDNNTVRNCCYTGIGVSSAIGGSIDNNRIKNITQPTGYTNSYGIYTSRNQTANMTIDPRSANISISGNKIYNVPKWDGINTHAGVNHAITGNVLVNCGKPIEIVGCEDGGGTVKYAPLEISVVGNTMTSTVTDGSLAPGILFVGAQDTFALGTSPEYATGTVTGNVIRGHGTQGTSTNGAILCYYTKGLIVSNNTIVEPSPHGVYWWHDNIGFTCTGNTVIDPWTTAGALAAGVTSGSDYNTGYIGDNRIVRGTKTATLVASRGLYVANTSNTRLVLGVNDFAAATSSLYDPGVLTTFSRNMAPGTLSARPTATAELLGATYLATDVFGGTQYRVANSAGVFNWVQTGSGVTEASGADGTWKPRDSDFVAAAGDPAATLVNNQTATVSGTQYVTKVKADRAAAATSVVFYLATPATSVTDASVDLFNSAGTRIATADIATTITGAQGLKTVAFAAPTAPLAVGDTYYVGIRSTFTGTAPAFRGMSLTSIPNVNTPSGAKVRFGTQGTAVTSPQTAITPASILSSNLGAQCHWVGII